MDLRNEILFKYYGYTNLKPEQESIIETVMGGKDCLGLLPTGYGKSVCFQVPAMMMKGITIVITPLIALMQDQVYGLKKKKIEAEYINSLQDYDEQRVIYNRIASGQVKILYVSAERLESKYFISEIKKVHISMIVCDEAHTLLWSDDFRLALGHIPNFIKEIGYRPVFLALTATATSTTVKRITDCIKLINPLVVVGGCDRENIFYHVDRTEKKLNSLIGIISKHRNELGIVYCLTIKNTNYVYDYLKSMGYKVGIYHGSMDSMDKKRSQELFSLHMIEIMVCTNAFGMGIDIPDIRYVINYDLPSCIEDFVQQSGRGSRDGKRADSYLLFSVNDIKTANYFIEHLDNPEKTFKEIEKIKADKYKKLDKMIEFALSRRCLHQYIVEYFGQKIKPCKTMCNSCNKTKYI